MEERKQYYCSFTGTDADVNTLANVSYQHNICDMEKKGTNHIIQTEICRWKQQLHHNVHKCLKCCKTFLITPTAYECQIKTNKAHSERRNCEGLNKLASFNPSLCFRFQHTVRDFITFCKTLGRTCVCALQVRNMHAVPSR